MHEIKYQEKPKGISVDRNEQGARIQTYNKNDRVTLHQQQQQQQNEDRRKIIAQKEMYY